MDEIDPMDATLDPGQADPASSPRSGPMSAPLRWLVGGAKLLGELLYLALGTAVLTRLGLAVLGHFGVAPIAGAITRDVAVLAGLLVLTARLVAVRHPLGAFGLRALRDAVAGVWIGLIVGPAALPALFGLPFTALMVLDFAVFLALAALLSDLLSLLDTAIHEGGHVIAGLLVGYPPRSMRVGPVEIRRTGRGPRLAWSDRGSTDGSTEVIFRPKRWARLREAVLSAAGALASIAVAVLIWRLVDLSAIQRIEGVLGAQGIAAFGHSFSVAGLTFITVRVFVAGAIAISIFNLLPISPNLDGASLLDALRGGPDFARGEALAELQEIIMRGARPRDWPADVMARVTAPEEDGEPLPAIAYLMAYYVALDRGELLRASWHLDRLIATSWLLSPSTVLEVAYFVARYRHDAALARVWLDRGTRRHEKLRTSRALAAILLVEGDAEKALAATEAGLQELARLRAKDDDPDAESLALPEEQLRQMAAEARAALTVGVAIMPTQINRLD